MNMKNTSNDIVLSTKSFDDIEAKTTITKNIQNKSITIKSKLNDHAQTAKLEWNIDFSDGLIKYSNEGSNKAFPKFTITKKIQFNTNKDYMALNLETKFDKETDIKGFRIQKTPQFNVFIDY